MNERRYYDQGKRFKLKTVQNTDHKRVRARLCVCEREVWRVHGGRGGRAGRPVFGMEEGRPVGEGGLFDFARIPRGASVQCAPEVIFPLPHPFPVRLPAPLSANANCLLICHSCPGKCNSDPPPGYIRRPSRPCGSPRLTPFSGALQQQPPPLCRLHPSPLDL